MMFLRFSCFTFAYIFFLSIVYACNPEWMCVDPGVAAHVPHHQDPFKERVSLKECEECLKNKIFPSTKASETLFDIKNPKVIKIGPFIVDERLFLGEGERGFVYLAYEPSSDILFAAKKMSENSLERLKNEGDYISLKKLDRLFGLYQKNDWFYVFMPFGGIQDICQIHMFLKNKNMFEHFETRLELAESVLNELSYLASRGVRHYDQAHFHYKPGWNYKNVLTIDFESGWFKKTDAAINTISEEIFGVTAVHQRIINGLILGENFEAAWRAHVAEKEVYSEDFRNGLKKFKQSFKNEADAETISLKQAKSDWEDFKKTLNCFRN